MVCLSSMPMRLAALPYPDPTRKTVPPCPVGDVPHLLGPPSETGSSPGGGGVLPSLGVSPALRGPIFYYMAKAMRKAMRKGMRKAMAKKAMAMKRRRAMRKKAAPEEAPMKAMLMK